MELRFFGAVRTTTGSMHLVSAGSHRVLLDCGLYQGKRKEAFERNRTMPVEPQGIDAVVLSHAHIDHSGNLPTLVRRGYRGPVYATPATIDLCDIMLRDAAYLQERDVEYVNRKRRRQGKRPFEPLYTAADVEELMRRFEPVDYETAREAVEGLSFTYHDAGHILGAAITQLDVRSNGATHRVLFTGDMGRKGMPILKDPVVVPRADTLITESTYGDRHHPPKADVQAKLQALVNEVCEKRSKLVIPAFSVGRTQQLVYFLDELHEKDRIPELPVYVDSPLSTRATEVYRRHPECYDQEARERFLSGQSPFSFARLRYITDAEDSKALNHAPGPMVIISASGMCEGGRILHHLKNNIEDPKNIVLFVGYQAEHTLGRYLISGRQPVRIYGEEYLVRARIEEINALSAHADHGELMDYFRAMEAPPRRAFVVHGELPENKAIAGALRELGVDDVVIPQPGQRADL
ncbi:MAG: MBL fold metallo-hydrolase [Candidatus Brocadiia bacterium]